MAEGKEEEAGIARGDGGCKCGLKWSHLISQKIMCNTFCWMLDQRSEETPLIPFLPQLTHTWID
jgi:hypothetical protein